jgi:hypothetical protein
LLATDRHKDKNRRRGGQTKMDGNIAKSHRDLHKKENTRREKTAKILLRFAQRNSTSSLCSLLQEGGGCRRGKGDEIEEGKMKDEEEKG